MDISEVEQNIRELIKSGRLQAEILADDISWNMLCSSLDLVADTDLALDSYIGMAQVKAPGECYLLVYGVLQALMLQQDAAKHIARALGIKIKLPKQLNDIRIVRNSAAGHPGFQMENKQARSCFISRSSLTATEFDLITVYSGGRNYQNVRVNIPAILKTQEKYLESTLKLVLDELIVREKEHYKMHQGTKLASHFSGSTSFYFQKIFEAILSESKYELGEYHLELVKNSLAAFKQQMEDRKEWGVNQEVDYQYNHAEYSSSELASFFQSRSKSRLNEKDACVFASFLKDCVSALKTLVSDIDAEYEQAGEST